MKNYNKSLKDLRKEGTKRKKRKSTEKKLDTGLIIARRAKRMKNLIKRLCSFCKK